MLISHYGYSSSRAVMSFVIFVLFGTAMYATALFVFQQPFLPVESDPSSLTYEFAFGLARHATENGCPGLHIMHYALDAALPVVDLGQDLRCQFTPLEPGARSGCCCTVSTSSPAPRCPRSSCLP
ncbi:MAG: hypothetical protein U5K38_06925 [Woeseiaceae bacterium]|nr:hypothetical protein [Woeseiaceae bacterium]